MDAIRSGGLACRVPLIRYQSKVIQNSLVLNDHLSHYQKDRADSRANHGAICSEAIDSCKSHSNTIQTKIGSCCSP
jgi:hypothetical protein